MTCAFFRLLQDGLTPYVLFSSSVFCWLLVFRKTLHLYIKHVTNTVSSSSVGALRFSK